MRNIRAVVMLWVAPVIVVSALMALPANADDTGLLAPLGAVVGTTGNSPTAPGQALVDNVATGATNDSLCALFKTDNPPSHVIDSAIYGAFGLDVPAEATVDGITVVVSGYRTGPGALTGLAFKVRLSGDAGVTWTGYEATAALTNTDNEYVLGGATDLWGQVWLPAGLSDAGFLLEIMPDGPVTTGEHWKLDSVAVQVDYTLGSDPEGLSHGYWKNHTTEWTGYATTDTLGSVFTLPAGIDLGGVTFSDALDFTGGPTITDKSQLLLMQAVAALLNAADPNIDYPLTGIEIIDAVNQALATYDPATIETLKDLLDGYNNLGADLNS